MAYVKIDIKSMQYVVQIQAGCLLPMLAARTESHIEDRVWNQFDQITGWSLVTNRRLTHTGRL